MKRNGGDGQKVLSVTLGLKRHVQSIQNKLDSILFHETNDHAIIISYEIVVLVQSIVSLNP